ncbi:MAG: hypothetical protein CMH16_30285 [Methylobacterium sp.]|jgi:hypothetical protein|nr:hypothetical protein [Methylobacterium sp.]
MSFMRVALFAVAACLASPLGAAEDAGQTVASEGDWVLRKAGQPSSRDADCILAPKTRSRIQIVGDRLEVTGLPKNSILNYQYRIDDGPVSNAMFPTAQMQEIGVISLNGDVLKSILNGRRFSIRLLDRWHEAITEEISLAGLRSLRDQRADACKSSGAEGQPSRAPGSG